MSRLLIVVSCQSSINLHDVMGTHWGYLVNRLFISMMSFVRIRSAFSQLSICFYDVTGTHWGCLVNQLFDSIMLRVLNGCALSIVYFSP